MDPIYCPTIQGYCSCPPGERCRLATDDLWYEKLPPKEYLALMAEWKKQELPR